MRIILPCEFNKFEFPGGGAYFHLNFILFISAKNEGNYDF